jgi:1-acyl-sn-glycerol-3-phosphate acyltransferase
MQKQHVSRADWHYTRWGGIISVRIIKFWIKLHRTPIYSVDLKRPINPNEPTVLASNHQTLLDPPAIFAALPFRTLLTVAPVKFMTYHKYYHSKYKLPLYTTGCYPSHGEGLTGVTGAVYFARHGYRSFIFPEGKRTKITQRGPAYEGISKILQELPEARLILVRLDWHKRKSFFSRPILEVSFFDAPDKLDISNPDKIMDVIYAHK